jgi:hypothetical protein
VSNSIYRKPVLAHFDHRGDALRYAWLRAPPLHLSSTPSRSGCLTTMPHMRVGKAGAARVPTRGHPPPGSTQPKAAADNPALWATREDDHATHCRQRRDRRRRRRRGAPRCPCSRRTWPLLSRRAPSWMTPTAGSSRSWVPWPPLKIAVSKAVGVRAGRIVRCSKCRSESDQSHKEGGQTPRAPRGHNC